MNPYHVLHIDKEASLSEIKSAYRRLASEYHPDRFHGAPKAQQDAASEEMKQINLAYEMLKAIKPKAVTAPTNLDVLEWR